MKSSNLKRNNRWKQAGKNSVLCCLALTVYHEHFKHGCSQAGGRFGFGNSVMQKSQKKYILTVEGCLSLSWLMCCVACLLWLQRFQIMSLYLILEKWENIVFDSIGKKSDWVASKWLSELCYCCLSSVDFSLFNIVIVINDGQIVNEIWFCILIMNLHVSPPIIRIKMDAVICSLLQKCYHWNHAVFIIK